jgi:hypothetical protein
MDAPRRASRGAMDASSLRGLRIHGARVAPGRMLPEMRESKAEEVEVSQSKLFESEPAWAEHWVGMPEYVQGDERPSSSLQVFFRTEEDRHEFLESVGYGTGRTRGIWWPHRPPDRESFSKDYEPEKVPPNRYPVYVISKGRWHGSGLTYRALENLGIDYRIVVEPPERDDYAEFVEAEKILALPFSDLGQGSIPARNWVWDHAVKSGAERHWILDDNIADFARLNRNKDRIIKDENPFIPAEDFVDRYENVGLAGFDYRGFGRRDSPNFPPFRLNTRIYSCILVNHALPFRWRGRYNEDTDLSIRALKAGWVTVLFLAYRIHKAQTMTMNGGNTDELYAGNGRLKMAEALQEQHPDVVSIYTRWGRRQHFVDYSSFKGNRLKWKGKPES